MIVYKDMYQHNHFAASSFIVELTVSLKYKNS